MKRLLFFLMALTIAFTVLPVSAFAGGGDPLLGDWNMLMDKSREFEIHKDKLTGNYTFKDHSGEKIAQKKSEKVLAVMTEQGEMVLSLDTSSGSLNVSVANAAPTEYRKNNHFITLTPMKLTFLFMVGLIGGLVSGFIGSGGAFVLTPGMMSLGVDGLVAVASNMCHKFPKALVGAIKRYRYGQVDLKLGLVMGVSATAGVFVGIELQKFINELWGEAGSNLYVSFAFVVVLVVVGSFVFSDARKIQKSGGEEKPSKLALALQKINLPPMLNLTTAKVRTSFWFTVPVGFATGLLAATIAVGGFIGVPGMIFLIGASGLVASATELVIAFTMGFAGSIQWGMLGLIDIRLTLIILAGSLIGVQLGALGTTYVKDYMIKIVMGTIMLMVAVSRGFAIPAYLRELGLLSVGKDTVTFLNNTSFGIMAFALVTGAGIILNAMIKGMKQSKEATRVAEAVSHGRI